MMADVKFTAVPYKGVAPAITDLLGGHVALMFCPMASVVGQVRGGNLRAIAVTGAKRSPLFPDVPTVAEAGTARLCGGAALRSRGAGRHAARGHRQTQCRAQ